MIQTSHKFGVAPAMPLPQPPAEASRGARTPTGPENAVPTGSASLEGNPADGTAASTGSDLDDRIRIVKRDLPWDFALIGWLQRQISTPRRLIRLAIYLFRWVVDWYGQARMLVTVIRSPEVADSTYQERQEICSACQENDDGYCRACGCPRWIYAQLDRKNRRSEWLCPRRRHPGDYPQYRCQGCGGGQAGGPAGRRRLEA